MPPPYAGTPPKADTSCAVDTSEVETHRRPHWRGERKAVLVRMPMSDAELLRAEADTRGVSVSELAASLIASGLAQSVRTAA